MSEKKNYHKNPRHITRQRQADLRDHMIELGDLSGVTFDLNSKELITGNQRGTVIDINNAQITYTEEFDVPTKTGTVALGYILFEGERFNYREVRWSKAQCEKANIIANVAAGEWDMDILSAEFDFGDLCAWGLEGILPTDFVEKQEKAKETRIEEAPAARPDLAVELRKKWGTEEGQLWLIPSVTMPGKFHRLLCGDSTNPDDVQRLMNNERAILFATDPPYLVDYDGTNHPGDRPTANKDHGQTYKDWDRAVEGDGLYDGFISQAIAHAIEPNAAWYCWHASKRQAMLEEVWTKHGAFVHQQIIWAKNRGVLTRSHYMWRHEPCFFGWIQGNRPPRRSQDYETTVWDIPTVEDDTAGAHPTPKPLKVFTIPMEQHTQPGELCYEPFSGSGSQLVAGESVGRRVYAMERAPEYVAVALDRLSEMGLEPVLEGQA